MRLFLPLLTFLLASAPLGAQVILDPGFDADGRRTVSFDLDAAATDSARRIFPTIGGGYLLVGQASSGSGIALALTRLTAGGQLGANIPRCEANLDVKSDREVVELVHQGQATWMLVVEGRGEEEGPFALHVQCRPGLQ
jgi:hypothetical protein